MRRIITLLFVATLVAASCTPTTTEIGSDDPGAVTPPADPTEAAKPEPDSRDFDDPSAGPDRSPAEPRQVPPLILPATAPGTDQAAAALLEDLDRFITPDQQAAGVPWPDLRNPDPVASYQAAARFQNWMSTNNPTPSLVEAYTAAASPERGFDLELFEFLNNFDLRAGPATPPYSMRVEALVHPAATGITDALLAQVPDGSAAVLYWDSVGPSDTFTAEGQYWDSSPGWTDEGPWAAIMAPTDFGWQVWWDELTDPPPPGSRKQQGTPEEEQPRRDV
jgi:hypothetical protein